MRGARWIGVTGLALAVSWGAGGPGLLAGASGRVPETVVAAAGAETRLEVRGLRGEIDVRLGKPGEIRYLASPGAPGAEAPRVGLVRGEGRILLGPAGEGAPAEGRLEVAVPPGILVVVATSDGKVWASGLRGGLEVEGERIAFDGRGLQGGASVSVEGGSLSLLNVSGDVLVEAKEAKAELAAIEGKVLVNATGGTVSIRAIRGDLDAAAFGAELSVDGAQGAVTLRARGGRAVLAGLAEGATAQLEGTPLLLTNDRGDIEVHSDAAIEFRECSASLHFGALGGPVRGARNEGLLEIRSTGGGAIEISDVTGPVGIETDGGTVRLKDIATALSVLATGADLSISGARGPVVLESERGTIDISKAQGDLDVTSRGDEVRLREISGAVRVEADGPVLEVGWAGLPPDKDSSIRNAGGGATVTFGATGGAVVEAVARAGRVESEWASVVASPDGASARGTVGKGGKATVRIEAEGDVRLLGEGGDAGDR